MSFFLAFNFGNDSNGLFAMFFLFLTSGRRKLQHVLVGKCLTSLKNGFFRSGISSKLEFKISYEEDWPWEIFIGIRRNFWRICCEKSTQNKFRQDLMVCKTFYCILPYFYHEIDPATFSSGKTFLQKFIRSVWKLSVTSDIENFKKSSMISNSSNSSFIEVPGST